MTQNMITNTYPIAPFKHSCKPHSISIGVQYLFNFPSGYRTSIVKTPFSYGSSKGKYELAVLDENGITYNTPITSNVIGWLTLREAFYITALVAKFTKTPNNPHIRKSRYYKKIKQLEAL